ncbi:uncharacterized protein RAG0_02576 [Rhynchosporium agropyri]|uniref:Uncharacterized protein n=1 Tax=Rhynchosporium agropyri TaxID=914238 RepID=A0A1E1K2F3_9HELO|nr:uncharacterized protein RAG0_02576 [Rhynchosporium agropyri]
MQHILSAKAIVKLAPTKTCALLPSSLKCIHRFHGLDASRAAKSTLSLATATSQVAD